MVNKPNKIIVHHTGGTDANPLADTSHHTFEMIDALHKAKGWGGCGYHYFIDRTGKVTQGRQDNEEGAHTVGQNTSSIGICLAGNFDATLPTKEQTEWLTSLLKQKCKQYLISDIYPHRHFSPKSCYGSRLSDTWASDLIKEPETVENKTLKLQLQLKILQLKLQIMKLLGY